MIVMTTGYITPATMLHRMVCLTDWTNELHHNVLWFAVFRHQRLQGARWTNTREHIVTLMKMNGMMMPPMP